MGRGGEHQDHVVADAPTAVYTLAQVGEHNTAKDGWLVINNQVYNVTNWIRKHPGGRVIFTYLGQDATDAVVAFHPDQDTFVKYLKPLHIGSVDSAEARKLSTQHPIIEDFRQIRESAKEKGLFTPNYLFFLAMFVHVLVLEVLARYLIIETENSWFGWVSAGVLLATAQAQAGWLQHDFGHLSVFKSSKWNHFAHQITIGHLKGASSSWWNSRHFRHHAKPNVVKADPDISMPHVFILGKRPAAEWGRKKIKSMPYEWQHRYWHLLAPPLIVPIFFVIDNLKMVFRKKNWVDLAFMLSMVGRYALLFGSTLGWGGTFKLYFFMRFIESHWFVWVTQMNHIAMTIDWDEKHDWPTLQALGTCDVKGGMFNDWFTGHLNYQVEHHLFPTMPRHNYAKIAPQVEAMYKKHNVPYVKKDLWPAFVDVVNSLEEYGNIWREAYYEKK